MGISAAISRCAAALGFRRSPVGAIAALFLTPCGVMMAASPCFAAAIVMAQRQSDAPATPAPTATQAENGAKAPENLEPLSSSDATPVLGKKVKGPNGEDLGLIVDVLVDADGGPRAAVIDFGGFLGVGSRKIAIDWKALDFKPLRRAGSVGLGLSRAQIAAAPEYKPGAPSAIVMTAPPGQPPVDTDK
jgi:hypothetical protein